MTTKTLAISLEQPATMLALNDYLAGWYAALNGQAESHNPFDSLERDRHYQWESGFIAASDSSFELIVRIPRRIA